MFTQLPLRCKAALPLSLVLSFLITGCGGTLNAEEGYRTAMESLQQGKTAQATIELKNILTQEPDHSPGRQRLSRRRSVGRVRSGRRGELRELPLRL